MSEPGPERRVAVTIEAATHGRYLIKRASPGAPLLLGFHGYAETAELQLRRLHGVPGVDEGWLVVSVQALHPFYHGRAREVGASWMTRQDRELAIADNLRYVTSVVEAVKGPHAPVGPMVFAGFSQGVAMAFRAACASSYPVRAVIALGGDVPPELDAGALGGVRHALVGRGTRDDLYVADQWDDDCTRLHDAGVDVSPCLFEGTHEWTAPFSAAAGDFLRTLSR